MNVDLSVDFQNKSDRFFSADADFNLDAFMVGIFPIFIPTAFPNVSFNETNVYTAVSTKVVRKIGLLKRTTAIKEGSEIHTDNLLYDGRTGQVLLTSVGNEFDNDIYNFNYPAHWIYDQGMGQAFKNWGLEVSGFSLNSGVLNNAQLGATLNDYLLPGDMCILNAAGKMENIPVVVVRSDEKTSNPGSDLSLIDMDGNLITSFGTSNASLRVIRSGRRNMAAVSIGSITCMQNPIQGVPGNYSLSFDQVLATSAVEYKDRWRTELPYVSYLECDPVGTDKLTYWLDEIDDLIAANYFQNTGTSTFFDLDECSINKSCESPYVYNPASDYCVVRDTVAATFNGSLTTAVAGTNVDNCREARLYDEEFGFIPWSTATQGNGTLEFLDKDSRMVGFDVLDDFWKTIGSEPRLKSVAIWSSSPILNQWMGFSFCVDAPETKSYFIGFGSDDNSKLTVNGKHVLTMDSSSTDKFRVWHVVEIPLNEGRNTIEIEGLDVGYKSALGAQIYDASRSELKSFTSNTELDATVIFSTFDKRGQTFDLSTTNGYSCPDGYYLDKCGSTVECIKVDSTISVQCPCPTTLSSQSIPVQDIVEVISHRPLDQHTAYLTTRVLDENGLNDTLEFVLSAACDTLYNCVPRCRTYVQEERVNPYYTGLRGNWRPFKSWTYVADRSYNAAKADPKNDGAFAMFNEFWKKVGNGFEKSTTDDNWVWTSEVTEYSPYGMELENMDPLGRYSAADYGFSQTLPIAVGSNMRHRQLWYEGFEEYQYLEGIEDQYVCPQWEWNYDSTYYAARDANNLDDDFSHSGNISLNLQANDSLTREILLNPDFDSTVLTNWLGKEYMTRPADQVVGFRPTPGKYVLSAWVHQQGSERDTSYDETLIKLEVEDGSGTTVTEFRPTGIIIEGWQRIEASFTLPQNPELMRIKYVSGTAEAWFDDVRIHPYDGNMKSYAYDFRTLRLMAELDENNYATFYEYDLEGNLVRVKKETIRGIETLQENRQHQVKSN
ncbi:MAG: hypothetical protein JJ975_08455 [Bacteroidia bacterium]|nr:hypothetical protein [Bacteroidia bacterium]